MRDTFDSLYDLLTCYKYCKFHVTSKQTLLPTKDFGDKSRRLRAMIQQSSMEEKFALIGTVERFATWYHRNQKYLRPISEECLLKIFFQGFCKEVSSFPSWGSLANHFKHRIKKGDPMPRRLQSRGHLHDIYGEMEEVCEKYFIGLGLVVIPEALPKEERFVA